MIVVVIVAAGADLPIGIVSAKLPVPALPVQYPGLICPVVLVWQTDMIRIFVTNDRAELYGKVP